MAESVAFTNVCTALENETGFSRVEARGTVRLAFKGAGLDAKSVTVEQMKVVLDRVLPAELEIRGIADSEAVCRMLSRGLGQIASGGSEETPEDVFCGLGGN